MKNLLLLACFICCGVSAQQYHPLIDSVQNRWTYATQFIGVDQPESIADTLCGPVIFSSDNPNEYTGADTLLGNYTYKKLYLYVNFPFNQNCLLGFIREDASLQQVWFWAANDTAEYLLYDFSLNTGDTFYIENIADQTRTGNYIVTGTGIASFAPGQLKTINLLCTNCQSSNVREFWVEGIGSLTELVYSRIYLMNSPVFYGQCLGDQHQYFQFLACFEQQQRVYWDTCAYQQTVNNPGFYTFLIDTCNFYYSLPGSIDENDVVQKLDLVPNPSDEQTTLLAEIIKSGSVVFSISDYSGRIILQKQLMLNAGQERIDIPTSHFSDGLYFVMLASESGISRTKLMIKH
jgi:Secretion system C-terminal sorting domain